MGIYIPGRKMPTACISCPFMVSRDGDDCILQSHEANASFLNWEQMKAGCPLVELPPHGRLIDADFCTKIDMRPWDAPTIIPADPEEGSVDR